MNSQYPALFSANWTRTAYYIPRWFDINAVPDLTDFVPLTTEAASSTPVPETGSYTDVPALWELSNSSLASNPSVLASVLESFAYEIECSRIATLQVDRGLGASIETTQPGHLWIVPTNTLVVSGFRPTFSTTATVQVRLSDNSYVDVVEADSLHSLFYGGQWGWYYDRPYLCIFGPGITETGTTGSSGWATIDDQTLWDRGSLAFVQQTVTERWIPFYPDEIREDGMLGIRGGPFPLRYTRPNAQRTLDELTVRINGVQKTATRVMITNSLDNSLVVNGMLRKPTDYLWELGNRAQAYHAVSRNQAAYSVQARLAILFGGYLQTTVGSGVLTSTIYPTGYNYAVIPEVPYFDIWREALTPASGSVAFITSVASADIWQAFENNRTQAMEVSGYYCTFDYQISTIYDRPFVLWLVTNYQNTGGSLVPTPNFPSTRSFQLLFTKDVSIPEPSDDSKDEATKLSYLMRWKSQAIASDLQTPELIGRALFV